MRPRCRPGETVLLQVDGALTHATVLRDRGDNLLDLHVPGYPDQWFLSVGRSRPGGWVRLGDEDTTP